MLTEELVATLRDAGAALVGVGSMEGVDACAWPTGISVAVRLPEHIVRDLLVAPTAEYGEAYDSLNAKLDGIVEAGAAFLQSHGYETYAQTTKVVKMTDAMATAIPHKTVATRAGLGWIGKSCLLVTPQFGSAVRISSLFTNAPLEVARPIDESRCGNCRACVKSCPAQALHDELWRVGTERSDVVDVARCDRVMREISANVPGLHHAICGKCIAVCPHTRRALRTPA